MKTLVARHTCAASPRDAWYALRGFQWPVSPDEIAASDAADVGEDPGFVGGRPPALILFEGDLRCRIVALDSGRSMRVSVRWRRLLNAELGYEVVAAGDHCELVCTRSYHGLVTRYLATIWRAREEEEQAGVLRDWCWEAGTIAAQRRYAS